MKFALLYYGSALTLCYGVLHLLLGEGANSAVFAFLAIPAYFLYSILNDQLNERDQRSLQVAHKDAPGDTDRSDTRKTSEINGDLGPVVARRKRKANWTLERNGLRKGSVVIPLDFLSVPQGGGKRLAIDAKSGYPPFTICFDNIETDIEWTQLIETLSRREKLAPDPERVVTCSGCGVGSKLKDFLPSPLGEGGVQCPLCRMNFLISPKS